MSLAGKQGCLGELRRRGIAGRKRIILQKFYATLNKKFMLLRASLRHNVSSPGFVLGKDIVVFETQCPWLANKAV
jgi:hypothetical protein